MIRLKPVSPAAIERLRDLYAMAPLYSTEVTHEADVELERAGWIELVKEDETHTAVEMAPAAYRDDGRYCCLYDDHGRVHPCWEKAPVPKAS